MVIFASTNRLRLTKEWEEIDRRLQIILLGLDYFMYDNWGIHCIVVCLVRTAEENMADGGVPFSSHLPARKQAADLRVWELNTEQIEKIKQYLISTWGEDFLCVQTKDHGTGPHIHININYKYFRKEAITSGI